jgi:hypothetical protein
MLLRVILVSNLAERLFEKYYIKPVISKNLTPLPPFPAREWGF